MQEKKKANETLSNAITLTVFISMIITNIVVILAALKYLQS